MRVGYDCKCQSYFLEIYISKHAFLLGYETNSEQRRPPGCMFANCGRVRYNGARMCRAMRCACAK